ncbi:MAG TPA: dephospho-CoA kinase [Candidatus Poseidoniales archaeon]|nr:MAG: dephospho-CoA kinase [Euryarchaeota archaeon]HIA39875.1 dephospho-CoA kinase [Candidatus Poseidoniales archaeon]PXY75581.1 MAG: dephospho-CoA kinase [Euryarchaeota archaeon]HIA89935.1 dephospho-CoA kinase [Candidatus Poseidoniales archaeon]HIB59628.1 dephospho-CoA kinase [Candidatus Poseidoniales archaeon]
MAKVVAICGMPGSGKGVFAEVAMELGLPVRSMGDMIRAEVEARELTPDPHVFGRMAQELRDEYGDGVLAARLAPLIDAELANHELMIIEGMRGVAEREIFLEHWGADFSVVAIDSSPPSTRFARITARGRSEDGDRASFEVRDQRERRWGLQTLIKEADFVISNSESLESFTEKSHQFLLELSA